MTDDHLKITADIYNFVWLYTQADDLHTKKEIDKIVAIEKSYLNGVPIATGTALLKLQLGGNTIWTYENTTHSIPYGYVQIFMVLDSILPQSFKESMERLMVDVGANEGHWSLYMAKKHPKAVIIAIEPNPIALELLHKNIESNNIKSVEILPVAASNKEEFRQFEIIDNLTSLGSFEMDRQDRPWLTPDRVREIRVKCNTLDTILQNNNHIDLLKIDVEGAELVVMAGAINSLKKTEKIIIEYARDANRTALIKLLTNNGFDLILEAEYTLGRGDLFFHKK